MSQLTLRFREADAVYSRLKMKGHCNSNERVELTLKLRRKHRCPRSPAPGRADDP